LDEPHQPPVSAPPKNKKNKKKMVGIGPVAINRQPLRGLGATGKVSLMWELPEALPLQTQGDVLY